MKKLSLLLLFIPLFSCGAKESRPPLHGAFDLREGELMILTALLPGEIRENIAGSPGKFLELFLQITREPGEYLWLVDKNHSLPADYAPEDLVDLADYDVKITKESLLVRKVILEDLLLMIEDAEAEEITLQCASTYRSYQNQKWLFDYWVRILGQKEAEVTSARPGLSQHQLGTTIDFAPIEVTIEETAAGKWLLAKAWKYGFSLSYPRGYDELTGYTYEPWHYRYVGRRTAFMIETYFIGIQQHFLEFYNDQGKILAGRIRGEIAVAEAAPEASPEASLNP